MAWSFVLFKNQKRFGAQPSVFFNFLHVTFLYSLLFLLITNYKSLITDYQLQITNYLLLITNHLLLITNHFTII